MRVVGSRREPDITFNASGQQLAEGARFNDEIHCLPTGGRTFVSKGIYRFRSFEEANRHDLDCVVKGVVQAASDRV